MVQGGVAQVEERKKENESNKELERGKNGPFTTNNEIHA